MKKNKRTAKNGYGPIDKKLHEKFLFAINQSENDSLEMAKIQKEIDECVEGYKSTHKRKHSDAYFKAWQESYKHVIFTITPQEREENKKAGQIKSRSYKSKPK